MDLNHASQHLQANGILIYPTDTVYGMGCLMSSPIIERLAQIKPRKTGFIMVTDDWEKCLHLISEPISVNKLLRKNPTTWVFDATEHVPQHITNHKTVAIRVITHEPTVSLLKLLPEPLISTSANLPGNKAPQSYQEIDQEGLPFPIMDGENGYHKPSQIIIHKSKVRLR